MEKYRKELLAHAHYSPNHILPTVSRDDLTSFQKLKLQKQQAKLQRHYDNLNLHGQGDLNDADPHANQNRQFLAFRRSSKFGIEYLLSQTQKQIHFVLDRVSRGESPQLMAPTDANMASLVNPDKLQRSHLITGSELRYAFRHWNELKEKGRFFFYMGGKRVSPPWEMQAFMGMWDQYAANRIKKVEASKVEPVRPPPSRGRLLLGRPNRTDS